MARCAAVDNYAALRQRQGPKNDPAPFTSQGRVDPLTMLLTVGEDDERISLALRQELRSCEWYLG